jgi:hypothetical protein
MKLRPVESPPRLLCRHLVRSYRYVVGPRHKMTVPDVPYNSLRYVSIILMLRFWRHRNQLACWMCCRLAVPDLGRIGCSTAALGRWGCASCIRRLLRVFIELRLPYELWAISATRRATPEDPGMIRLGAPDDTPPLGATPQTSSPQRPSMVNTGQLHSFSHHHAKLLRICLAFSEIIVRGVAGAQPGT